jgi:hypothetical protein
LQSSAKEILNMIMHSCVFLKAHGLDTFGKNYSKSLINIPESFKISKSVHRHINVTNIHIGDALLANFDSDSMTYSLINCNYLDKNFSKIKVDTNAKHVTAQHTQLDNGEKVVTITLANDDGDMKKIHLYSTNQPNQCVLNDIALSSSPTSIYINGNKYLGYFKNRFEYDVYVPDVNDVNFSVDTTNSTKVEIIRNNDVVTLKCINQYQTLFYYFNLHQGQDDMVTTNIGFNDTAILTANTSVFQYKQTKMLDDNYGSYIGDTQIDGFSAFSINVQKSGYYNLTASISESQADRTFDQLKGNGEFELRTGQSLNDGNSFK